tara:strand:+ start:351 stop:536 length:186 start_codon:yes stop_codon:yes gene_type:complete
MQTRRARNKFRCKSPLPLSSTMGNEAEMEEQLKTNIEEVTNNTEEVEGPSKAVNTDAGIEK